MNDKITKTEITAYSYHPLTLKYIGETIARRDPLEKEERFLIPASATDIPPLFEEGKITKWNGSEWILEEIQEAKEPTPITLDERKQALKDHLIASRDKYLAATNSYTLRKIDEPDYSYPEQIRNKRLQAWQEIDEINSADTLKILNNFSETFE